MTATASLAPSPALGRPAPPYRAALAIFAAVLAVYVATLAPTVTFWDAGELIAASKILGIPHPPGTPLFVLIAHVWGTLVPVGEFAWRTNLLSAVLSSAGAACFFLVAHETLALAARGLPDGEARLVRLGGAAAAALAGAFTFTNWQNSNETEVYSIATLSIAIIAWLCHEWRARRGTAAASRVLLLIVYIGGVSMGNHLLALLVGPAVVTFVWAELRARPDADAVARRREWAQLAVLAGVWALLIGSGLGNTALVTLGGLCFVGAAAYAMSSGAGRFALVTLVIAAIGVTPYLFLFIRAGQGPMINEADPSTWEALLAVVRRAQYPVRTPFDDPTVLHGPDNPGRSLTIIGLQLVNYVQYFNWQFARSLGDLAALPATVGFFALGWYGQHVQRRLHRPAWWLMLSLFVVTGLGLMAYMNFKPGFSIGWEQFPVAEDHEVRERDYFFIVSFVTWGVWAGMGIALLLRRLLESPVAPWRRLAPAVLALAAIPLLLNWTAASRRHGPDARLAADFAYNLLNSTPPNGILFTYGDNDTFPLWWAQEVEGIRRDVTIVCLALGNTDWYMRQLREWPQRPLDRAALPPIWRDAPVPEITWPVHTMSDSQVAQAMIPVQLPQAITVDFGTFRQEYPAGTIFFPNDLLAIRVVQQNLGRRPMVWSVTAGRGFAGLNDRVVQRGLAYAFLTAPADTSVPGIIGNVIGPWPVDVPMTERLAWETYRYGAMLEGDTEALDPTSAAQARSLAYPFTILAFAHEHLGNQEAMVRNLERATQLNPEPALRQALQQLQFGGDEGIRE